METLITTRDLHENTEFSVQQAHSFEVETVLPSSQHPKGDGGDGESGLSDQGTALLDTEHTVVIIFQTILLIVLCILGTLTNSLVFWVFNRRPALRSLSNRFVLSLVTANILISSIIAPLMLFETILNQYLLLPCISESISMISSSVIFSAVFSTFLIATDRFYAVTSPLHYSMTITRSRSQVMIVVAWLCGVLLALPYIVIPSLPYNTELHQSLHVLFIIIQLVLGYIFPFVGLCWLYLRMYHAAHRNSERTRKHSISGELLTVIDGSTSVIPPQGIDFLTHYMNPFTKAPMAGSIQGFESRNGSSHGPSGGGSGGGGGGGSSVGQVVPMAVKKQRRRSSNGSSSSLLFREEGRAIKTAFLVLASFLLCWTPHFAFMLISEIDIIQSHLGRFVPGTAGMSQNSSSSSVVTTAPTPDGPLASTLNPVIHGYSSSLGTATFESDWVRFFGLFGILLSCLLNPFIYVFRNKMACKEVSKLLCRFLREKRRKAKHEALLRERHLHNLNSRDQHHNDISTALSNHNIVSGGCSDDSPEVQGTHHTHHHHPPPPYAPCIGKSPKRSSLKSLTPQSSLNSTITNCNSFTNVNSPINPSGGGILINSITKPPFIRSMTVPEQSQPRVKFPPNLVRQKSCVHRPVFGGTPTELTPALSKRSKFVRQDSICSILSNDSVLMICAEDGLCMSDIGLMNGGIGSEAGIMRGEGGGTNNTGRGDVGGTVNQSGGRVSGSHSVLANGNILQNGTVGGGSGTPLQKNYLRQDSNFSDASHKTNDSGIVLSTCHSSKQSSTESPYQSSGSSHSRNPSPNHLTAPKISKLSPNLGITITEPMIHHKTKLQSCIQTAI